MFNMFRGGVGSVVVRALSALCLLPVGCGVDLDDARDRPDHRLPASPDVTGAATAAASACIANPADCTNLSVGLDWFTGDELPRMHLHDARIDTSTGEVSDGGTRVNIPSYLLPRIANGTAIRAFFLDDVTIDNATVFASNTTHGPAFGIATKGDITLLGTLSIASSAGSMSGTQCGASDGTVVDHTDAAGLHTGYASGGGGGGGFGTTGSFGGSVVPSTIVAAGGAGGVSNGAQGLVPLRGGCAGGNTDDTGGGGAVELASQHIIEIDGTIDVRGAEGTIHDAGPLGGTIATGGGSGGGILLEAPAIRFAPDAALLSGGGTGGGSNTTSCDASICSEGGAGATLTMSARPGADVADTTTDIAGGGGGGGMGRIRINTATGLRAWSQTAVVQGAMTSGIIGTR